MTSFDSIWQAQSVKWFIPILKNNQIWWAKKLSIDDEYAKQIQRMAITSYISYQPYFCDRAGTVPIDSFAKIFNYVVLSGPIPRSPPWLIARYPIIPSGRWLPLPLPPPWLMSHWPITTMTDYHFDWLPHWLNIIDNWFAGW